MQRNDALIMVLKGDVGRLSSRQGCTWAWALFRELL